jgi:alkylation response protein AidB-like acyl-CoA dehydrogenase
LSTAIDHSDGHVPPFGPLDDIAMVQEAARGFLAANWIGSSKASQQSDLAAVWPGMARQGWTALGSSADASALAFCLTILQETGRASCSAPLLDAYLANLVLSQTPDTDETSRTFLAAMHRGEVIPTWIFAGTNGEEQTAGLVRSGQGVNGRAPFVENAEIATHFLFVVSAGEIAIVPRDQQGIRIVPTPGLSVPPLADVHFENPGSVQLVKTSFDLDALPSLGRLMLCARAFGAAYRGLEILTDYAKVRSQFGKKIGQYQAIQHKLVNLLIALETCRLALLRAGASGYAPSVEGRYPAAVAVACAARTLRDAVLEIHHGFGGVSFWDDHEMPRHFKRVHGDLVRLGGVHAARREIADNLLGPL